MRVLVDMNLAPEWAEFLSSHSIEATHWSSIGDPGASDATLLAWAREHGHLILTCDLDFGVLLALAGMNGPSVLQVRTEDVLPAAIGERVVAVLREFSGEFELGAVATLDPASHRLRLLPIRARG
ncbi:MAG: DUF5615 family PIN-like protein [Planctomycetota bacterium]|nr:DUF5615 family PIN-like protein [Planctomycetota bacterium]